MGMLRGTEKAGINKTRIRRGKESNDSRFKIWQEIVRKAGLVEAGKLEPSFRRTDAVCQRWEVLENFLADIGERPSAHNQYRRIDKRPPHGISE